MNAILSSRAKLITDASAQGVRKCDEEGGCGVVGFAASVPVRGRHIFEPSVQMHNRGNGKGGGIAAASLQPHQLGVDEALLRHDNILQIALLDPRAEAEVEASAITPFLRVDHKTRVEPVMDHRDLGLEARPPDIVRYFVRVREDELERFAKANALTHLPPRMLEDEFLYQNTYRLNQRFYAALGEKRAFVLSHARDLLIFKIVGYAEQVVSYYGLEDLQARVWIAHQRYPTKGRVWHPGGAHPFIGMNEALVHNGDFANYSSVTEYLRQNNIVPLFLTDTEVSALLFDLWIRVYRYPLEAVIEAMAPTTELDFERLPEEKRKVYRAIQSQHIHGSPDGPWFFIVARSDPDHESYQLLGITDTAMLRPQVFAIQEGEVSIGLVASEKQAIDATLRSLADEDHRFGAVADRYWNARGGSHTDGGAFAFTVQRSNGSYQLTCADKFGRPIAAPQGESSLAPGVLPEEPPGGDEMLQRLEADADLLGDIITALPTWRLKHLRWMVSAIARRGHAGLELLTRLNDRRYSCGSMKRSAVLGEVRPAIEAILDGTPLLNEPAEGPYRRIDWKTRASLMPPQEGEAVLVVHARGFEPEGEDSDARLEVIAYQMGWRRFIIYGLRGQRFTGCGFGPDTDDVRFDVYGSSGDYLASGIDGMEIHVHDNAQDQLAQIMKRGRLVIHGDVGQAFLYGCKGGEVYVAGNAAGRPLINAVGRPRVVINGTCLDYLAESFMAGDPHNGGGFVIVNAMEFDDAGQLRPQETPYPGSNLFSMASGGAIYVRDPHHLLVADQLNGGVFTELTSQDWALICPYLERNEQYFGIALEELLRVDGQTRRPEEVYRKVSAVRLAVLAKGGGGLPK